VAVLGFLHGTVHANILSIPVFLLAWQPEFRADNLTLGLLAASAYIPYGLGAVPFGFLADGRARPCRSSPRPSGRWASSPVHIIPPACP